MMVGIEPVKQIMRAEAMSCGVYRGVRASDGCFERNESGPYWMGFREPEDMVLWCVDTGEVASFFNSAFALNEAAIDDPSTYALGGKLHICATVNRWVMSEGRGIVVLDWKRAYHRLKDVPRIAVDETVLPLYERHMVPPGMPTVFVRPEKKRGS